MFLMPTRAVTQNYKMTLRNKRFKGSFLFWPGGSNYFNLTGSKILARVGLCSAAFPVGNVFSIYDLSDDNFALSPDYDLLYTELTGAVVLYIEEYGV